MNEHEDNDKVTLSCSVSTTGSCRHTVKWLYENKNVDEDNNMETSQGDCSITVKFSPSFLKQKSKHRELFKCEVTDSKKVQLFPFSLQSSGGKPGEIMMSFF